MQIRSASSNPFLSISAALLSMGLQIAWFIDPINGNDAGDGSAAAPLKTMDEFNARLSGNYIQVSATLQLLGDVLDAPLQLAGTRFKFGASLTVSGTRTQAGAGQITLVTPIGNAGTTFPFQLTTTGIDWTTMPAGSQIVLSGGQVGWIKELVDANNIVIGAVSLLTSNVVFTPTAGLSFTVFALSRGIPPTVSAVTSSNGAITTANITLQNLSFDGPFNLSSSGCGLILAGCEFRVQTSSVAFENSGQSLLLFRSCRIAVGTGGGLSFRSSGGRLTLSGGCCVSTAGTTLSLNLIAGSDIFLLSYSMQKMTLFLGFASLQITGGLHFEKVSAGPCVSISFGGVLFTGTPVNGRNCAGSSLGIDISTGKFIWNGAGAKPTIGIAAGCTADVRLGAGATGATFTFAQLGTGKQLAFLDAIPPTTTQITGGGFASCGQYN